ncbi:hypothetical protein GCM10029992_33480 [Glycomyces albus]
MLRDRPRRGRPHHRETGRLRVLEDFRTDFWGGNLLGFRAPNPRTLEPSDRIFDPNPDDDPLAVVGDQRRGGGDQNLWTFRRIAARRTFAPGAYDSDITLVNWPMIDYFLAPALDAPDAAEHLEKARGLSYSVMYWLQTEAPRPDGGTGWPGLRLRGDVTGSADGLAQAPTTASPGASRPSTPSSSRTCRRPCAATPARCPTATASASACTASTCTLHRR